MLSRLLITAIIFWATKAHILCASEPISNDQHQVLLYDVDYTDNLDQLHQPAEIKTILESPFPNRKAPTKQVFGSTTILRDPYNYATTTGIMIPSNGDPYSQLEFLLYWTKTYLFQSHRIRFTFKMHPSLGELILFTDASGLVYSLTFFSNGSIDISYYPAIDNPEKRTQRIEDFGSFNVNTVNSVELDLDRPGKRISLIVNGVETILEDAGVEIGSGIRNFDVTFSPFQLRLSYNDNGSNEGHLALYSIQIWGRDWEGPQYLNDIDNPEPLELNPIVLPIELPLGEWQGQFSFNMQDWHSYGGTFTGENVKGILTDKGVANQTFFRFVKSD